MSRLLRREQCPKCAEEGRDTRGDNLHIYEEGPPYCHAGHGAIKHMDSYSKPKSKLSVLDCLSMPVGHDPRRKIPEEVYKLYNIRAAYSEESGECDRVYYPYYNDSGNVTGIKIRILPKQFLIAGNITGGFGKQCSSNSDTLVIVEGEEDVLAMKAMLLKTAWEKWDCYSLANGASMEGALDKSVKSDLDYFSKYKKIIILLDTDTPGLATARNLANWLMGICDSIKLVRCPNGLKDASDVYLQGKWQELKQAIINTPAWKPEGIVHGSELTVNDLFGPTPKGFSYPFPGLEEKLHGIRKGELITICAGSGVGKSTLAREIGYHLVTHHDASVCHIALENLLGETAGIYVAMDNDVPAQVLKHNPARLDVATKEASMDRTVRKMYFYDHFGSVATSTLYDRLQYYSRKGVDFVILDHLSMVISGQDLQNERKEIDKIMTELASMVVATGVGIISVVHVKRRESRDGKSPSEGGQISLTDLRGSAALEQLSWAVIGLERDTQAEDGTQDFLQLRVLKNRTWGFCGKAGRLRYDHTTGRLTAIPDNPIETKELNDDLDQDVNDLCKPWLDNLEFDEHGLSKNTPKNFEDLSDDKTQLNS